MQQHDVRLVHAHQYAPFFYSSLARAFGARYPIVFTEHGRDFPDFRRPKRVWANKLLLRRKDRVVAVGEHVRTALIENEGFALTRVDVIYNGVDALRFHAARPYRDRVRAQLGLTDQDVGIIQVARLNRLKDYGTALHAIAQACNESPNVKYFIVGVGEEQSKIEETIAKLQLTRQVKMLGLRTDVSELLQGMDIFLLSSLSEGIPLTLIEAMLAQLPCVTTNVGGTGEVVIEGSTGYLAEAKDSCELARKLIKLVRSQDERTRMGDAGRKRTMSLFRSDRMFERYESMYAELCK
jgi:L-malate glycosyltransferase